MGHADATGIRYIDGIIPTVLTDIFTSSVAVMAIVLSSNDISIIRPLVTIQDRQATPLIFHFGRATPVSPGNAVEWNAPFQEGWVAVDGLSWICDTADAVVGRVAYIG